MATLELILLLLAAVLVSAVIGQFVPKIAAPLIQIVLGIFVEVFTADTVTINFSADLFLVLFIAPLLYDEARRADKAALMRNIKPVLGLAIGLVLITMFSIGGVVNWLVPAIPFTAALALGAALGPTDAVAVSSLPKDIEIGERRKQVLQGEYLLNDASGIVGFQFALAATITGAFSIVDASVKFLIVFFGGLVVGAVVGFAANAIERYIRKIGLENTTFHVLFDLFLPFIIYLVAEPFGASGIIAVVVGGLVRSLANKGGVEPVTSRLNIVSDSVWQTISFALNGVVFVLLGTQLPRAMVYTATNPLVGKADLLLWVVVITVILLATRFVWLLGEEWIHHRRDGQRLFGRENIMSALIMTIAGPKGAVTLSIIFTIPVLVSDSAFFPERSLIIFLASGVILLTLLLSNFVLPLFAPKKDLADAERRVRERDTEASIEVLRSVVRGLLARQTDENAAATATVVEEYNRRIASEAEANELTAPNSLELRLEVFDWERAYITEKIRSGEVAPLTGYRYINQVDRRENALLHQSQNINPANLWREFKELVRSGWRRVKQQVSADAGRQAEELQALRAKVYGLCIRRLQYEMTAGRYPAEAVSEVLLDYQRAVERVRVAGTGSARAQEAERLAEVEQTAIGLELDAITAAYDSGKLSRAGAKRLREKVTLMQVDLAAGE